MAAYIRVEGLRLVCHLHESDSGWAYVVNGEVPTKIDARDRLGKCRMLFRAASVFQPALLGGAD